MEVKHAQSVPTKQRIAYGLPNLSLAVMGIPIFVYLPIFYTDVVGISATTVGLVIIGARAMDAITDPLMGYWSDRTNTRWGRRRPYLIWAALPR
jgi:GPH family glycoside/pentoside/hexuronide:cation symporter